MEQWKYDKEEIYTERLYIDNIPQFKYRKVIHDVDIENTNKMPVESLINRLEKYNDKMYNVVIYDEDYLRIWHYEYYTQESKFTRKEIDTIMRAIHYSEHVIVDDDEINEYLTIVSKLYALKEEALRNET